jgi:FKBP-type peptidyl-prolyl cis-trans isomerase SlpA
MDPTPHEPRDPPPVDPGTSSVSNTASVVPDSYLTLHYRVGVGVGIGVGVGVGMEADVEHGKVEDVVSTFGGRPATLQLGAGQLSPALEERLLGLSVGAHRVFELSPGEAFGPRNPALMQRVSREVLATEGDGTDYSPGDVVEFNAPNGGRYAGVFRSLDNDYAVFDFNHPLAGQAVRFEVEILGIL